MKKKLNIVSVCICVAICMTWGFTSCNKEEFMPPEVGEKIPYEDTVSVTLVEVLSGSPYTLFYQAWQKSDIVPYLTEQNWPKYTLLAPDNASLTNAGWDAATIAAASVADIDILVKSHVFFGDISLRELSERSDNYPAANILEYPDLWYYQGGKHIYGAITFIRDSEFAPYHFRSYLGFSQGVLLLNGQAIGNGEPVPARDGYIWPVNKVIERPEHRAIEVLESEQQFSLYVQLMKYTDSLYRAIYQNANGGVPPVSNGAYDRDFVRSYGFGFMTRHPLTGAVLALQPMIGTLSSWFIPTNEAFHQAGFQNLEDLKAFNVERGLPTTVWNASSRLYVVQGEFATDTLLDYHHNWGRRFAPKNSYDGTTGQANVTVFYSNDLRQDLLNNYPINGFHNVGSSNTNRGDRRLFYYMPLDFSSQGNTNIQLQVKNTVGEHATVVDRDIQTLNGPIHGVNRLLVPAGFTLD